MGVSGRLENKVALITGAGSGIGRATAQRFAREGARLMLADLSEEGLATTKAGISASAEVLTRIVDVSREDQVESLVEATVQYYGRIDILCNNAGIACSRNIATEQDAAEWMKVLNVNLMGAVYATKYAARHMQAQGAGRS
nr:SDR family oxidoreductase [Alkalilimnicola ehrlichii]